MEDKLLDLVDRLKHAHRERLRSVILYGSAAAGEHNEHFSDINVLCVLTRVTPADTFGPFARRAQSEPGWRYHEIDASHSPNVTAPEALMALLQRIVAQQA